jgi:hypothetical protein
MTKKKNPQPEEKRSHKAKGTVKKEIASPPQTATKDAKGRKRPASNPPPPAIVAPPPPPAYRPETSELERRRLEVMEDLRRVETQVGRGGSASHLAELPWRPNCRPASCRPLTPPPPAADLRLGKQIPGDLERLRQRRPRRVHRRAALHARPSLPRRRRLTTAAWPASAPAGYEGFLGGAGVANRKVVVKQEERLFSSSSATGQAVANAAH